MSDHSKVVEYKVQANKSKLLSHIPEMIKWDLKLKMQCFFNQLKVYKPNEMLRNLCEEN